MGEGSISSYALEKLKRMRKGYVHSVFASSANIRCDCGSYVVVGETGISDAASAGSAGRAGSAGASAAGNHDFLLHLGFDSQAASCLGITLPTTKRTGAAPADLFYSLRPDNLVTLKNNTLCVYHASGVYRVSLDNLELYDATLDSRLCAEDLQILADLLDWIPIDEHTGLDLGAQKLNLRALSGFFAQLLGRGKGLTPSGDDLIVGCSIMLLQSPYRKCCLQALGTLDLAKTTDVSRAYLEALQLLQVNPVYLELMKLLKARRAAEVRSALQEIAGIGHTSGFDCLKGMQLATSALLASDTRVGHADLLGQAESF